MKLCKIDSEPISLVRFSVVFGVLLTLLASRPLEAQTFSASIAGTVTDPSGAMVSGAKLQLENTETRDIRIGSSSDEGAYNFTNLLPGTYRITVSAAGFKEFVRSDMVLRASTAATVNVSLEVGQTSEQVVVSAGAVLVNTENATSSITMDQNLIEALPNSTLQPLNFVFALAGTTESQGWMTSRSQTYTQFGSMFGINGGRTGEAEILIDGAPSTAIDWGGLMASPLQDSVREQQVVANVYDAQYERAGAGVVTLITKNGTSEFHGEVYDYLRNSWLDANTWYNNTVGAPRGLFHRNQFGGNLGGPIWQRHNLFFFGAYEGLRQPQTQSSALMTVPTAAEKKGDFSQTYNADGTLAVIYNPFSTHEVTDSQGNSYYTRDPFPGNQIPSGLIDSVGQKIASLYEDPNRTSEGPNDLNNYFKQGHASTVNDRFDTRIDWNQSATHRLFGRVSDRIRENNTPPCYFCNGADSDASNNDHGFQVVLNDTWTPNQNWVIDAYGAYTRWWEGQTSIGYGVADASTIGLSKSLFQAPLLPLVNATGYQTLGSTYSSYNRYVRYLSTGLVNVTRQLHQHAIKFGFNYNVALINNRQDAPGIFNFDRGLSSCDPRTDEQGNVIGPCQAMPGSGISGNAIADMLLGVGNGGTSIQMDPAMSQHSFGMYLQDDWRVTPRLTISAGLRYENQRPATERHNRVAYFNPKAISPISTAYGSPVYGAFEFAGVDGRSRYAWEPDNLNFGPRVGIAYRITNKLVGRVGSGIFYAPTSAMLSFDGAGQSPGYTAETYWIGTENQAGFVPTNLVSNPFPNGINQPSGNKLGALTYLGNGAGQIWVKGPHPVGAMYQWSMDFQYQVSAHSAAQIGYTGVRGRRLLYGNPNLDLDQLPTKDLAIGSHLLDMVPNPLASFMPDQTAYLASPEVAYNATLRPYPAFGWLQMTRSTPGARSQFDAFSAKYNHSFANGLSSITTYQWSKNLDNGSEALLGWSIGGQWRDATNTKLDYSLSTRDIPQSFAEAWVYELPYGTGRHWGAAAPQIVRQTIGGWNLSGAIRLESGMPIPSPVTFSWNPVSWYGFPGPGMPDLVGNPKPAHRSIKNWINPAAFQGVSPEGGSVVNCAQANCQPYPFKYGNEPQHMTQLREAPTKNIDLGIAKEFQMERVTTEFRADFLNAFNHPIFGGSGSIATCLDCGNIGTVYGTRNDPRNIQVALKVMF
jgi:hypothetical protein